MLVQTTFGNESYSQPPKTYLLNCLYEPPKGRDHPAMPISAAVRDVGTSVRSIGSPDFIPASNRSGHHGQWTIGRYDVPEFTFLRLEMQRRFGGMIYEYKKVLIRMREEAALRQLRIELTGHEHSNMVCCYWEGRFDIIKPEWFGALDLNVLRPEQYNQSDLSDWVTDIINEPEASTFRPVETTAIQTSSGRTVTLPARTGARKLTMKPRPK